LQTKAKLKKNDYDAVGYANCVKAHKVQTVKLTLYK